VPDNRLRQRLIDAGMNHTRSRAEQISPRGLQGGELRGNTFLSDSAHTPHFCYRDSLDFTAGSEQSPELKLIPAKARIKDALRFGPHRFNDSAAG
jgi:hypothetical protein